RVDFLGTFTSIATMPAGALIIEYGQQIVILQISSPPTLRWSFLNDGTIWPASYSVFVGSGTLGTGLYVQQDTLVVCKINGEVWVFTGVLGVSETLRRVDAGLVHPLQGLAKGAVVGSSVLYWTTGKDISAFTGAQSKMLTRPDIVPVSGFNTEPFRNNVGHILPLEEDNKFFIFGTVDGKVDDTERKPWATSFSPSQGWNRHTIPVTTYNLSSDYMGGFTSKDNANAIRSTVSLEGLAIIFVPSDSVGGNNTTIRSYVLNSRLETPYLAVGEVLAANISGLTNKDADTVLPVVSTLRTGEWWAPESSEVTVRSVMVDYSYDSDFRLTAEFGATVFNRFDISVEALQPADGTAVSQSTAIAFVPTAGTAIDGGTMKRGRELFQFSGQGAGGGFRVLLNDWRGIMIHRITVHADVSEARV
ncbi:MAG: hypothetical protein ACRDRT_06755, partial [Pseudonocardiaceae bacterium]